MNWKNNRYRCILGLVLLFQLLLPAQGKAFMVPPNTAYTEDLISTLEVQVWLEEGRSNLFILEVSPAEEYNKGHFITEINYASAFTSLTNESFIVDTGLRPKGWTINIGYGLSF